MWQQMSLQWKQKTILLPNSCGAKADDQSINYKTIDLLKNANKEEWRDAEIRQWRTGPLQSDAGSLHDRVLKPSELPPWPYFVIFLKVRDTRFELNVWRFTCVYRSYSCFISEEINQKCCPGRQLTWSWDEACSGFNVTVTVPNTVSS